MMMQKVIVSVGTDEYFDDLKTIRVQRMDSLQYMNALDGLALNVLHFTMGKNIHIISPSLDYNIVLLFLTSLVPKTAHISIDYGMYLRHMGFCLEVAFPYKRCLWELLSVILR